MRLHFIEFPDKPDDATKCWNSIIQVGGYTTYHINVHTKEGLELFRKSLTPIKTWNGESFFNFHCDLEKKCVEIEIWMLSWCNVQVEVDELRGFTVDDQFENPEADVPARYRDPLHKWSGILYQAFAYKGVLPDVALKTLANSGGYGYRFLRLCHKKFHPALVRQPNQLAKDYPTQ